MKILLVAINAKYIHSNLAVYDLAAYAKNSDAKVEIAEYTINQFGQEILFDIYQKKPDVVAFSCYIWNMEMVQLVAGELNQVAPSIRIWYGGPEASYEAKKLLQNDSAPELVMVGEGEETFLELAECAAKNNFEYSDVAGIVYRANDNIIENPHRALMDMDKIPFVYKHPEEFEHKIIYYESSRGCPFSCSYCLSSIDKTVRFKTTALALEELQVFLDHKVPQVKFVDRTFNCKHDHAYAIWQYILEHDNGVTNFHFEVSADLLKEEDFELFEKMRPGLIQLEIGVQSTYKPTIEAIKRTMNLSELESHVARVKAMGNIHQHLDLIVGLPYEDLERFKISFKEVHAMKPDQLQLGFLKVLKGSYMYEHAKEYDLVYSTLPPYEVRSTKWISFDEVIALKAVEEMVEVYYNSNAFQLTLQYILHAYDNPYEFYEKLGQYYENHGHNGKKHTRLARYEILREFILESLDLDQSILDECLMYDLYARENIKKRPSFAKPYGKLKNLSNKIKLSGAKHIEEFDCDILKSSELGEAVGKKQILVFDYEHRNPLTNDAIVSVLEGNYDESRENL